MGFRKCLIVTLTLTLTLFIITAALATAAPDTQMQVRVYLSNKAQLLTLQSLHPDIVYRGKGYVDIFTIAEKIKDIEQLGLKTEIIHEDIVAFYRSRLTPDKAMGDYKTLDEINAYLDQMIADHSDIMSAKVSIGQSLEGRDIWAVKISDNPEIDEDEPEILYVAAIHAREVITPEVLFYYMDWLTNNYGTDPEATVQIDEREIWFVPCFNVDGYYHNEVIAPSGGGQWRKNRRNNGDGTYGVDLNRNYGYEWGYDDLGSSPYGYDETYRGTGPFSEPETQAMRDFIISRNFNITVYYHSYSNLFLWPWGYDEYYTNDQYLFQVIGDSVNNFNGYTPEIGWGLYPTNGGSDDWGYGETYLKNRNYSFTLEVGDYNDGFWPANYRIPQLISENLEPNILLTHLAARVYSILPPAMPTVFLPDSIDQPSYLVLWNYDDTSNVAEAYELVELKNGGKLTDPCDNFDNFDNNDFILNPQIYHSSNYSFYSGSANYLNRYFQTRTPIPIKSANDELTFWTRYAIEDDYDYAYVEVSTDGINFTPIEGNITTNYDPYGVNRGNGITGSSGGWVEATFPLADYASQDIYFRFSYITDASQTEAGIYFDDIYPIFEFEYEQVLDSDISETHYIVTDREPGTYFYRVRVLDTDNQWGPYSIPASIQVYNPWICGDADNSGEVNVLDIIYLIDYKFKDGPAPEIMEAADVNADTHVDILDILYMIEFKYKDGPEPACQ